MSLGHINTPAVVLMCFMTYVLGIICGFLIDGWCEKDRKRRPKKCVRKRKRKS